MGSVLVDAKVPQPGPHGLEPLKVVEDKRLAVDRRRAGVQIDLVLHEVPGRQVPSGVLDHPHAGKARPAVQVLLVGELAVLDAVVAPLEALLAPPVENGAARGVVAKGDERHVVGAVDGQVSQLRREPVADD